jgi:solute carrier family 45 protein 1/2/4
MYEANHECRPWAMQCWAPFTFMGVEINRLDPSTHSSNGHKTRDSIELSNEERNGALTAEDETIGRTNTGGLAGVYLGILNLFVTLPQFIGTFISWAVFSILAPGKSPELATDAHADEHHPTGGPNAIAVCLFIGALSAAMAAYATHRLKN